MTYRRKRQQVTLNFYLWSVCLKRPPDTSGCLLPAAIPTATRMHLGFQRTGVLQHDFSNTTSATRLQQHDFRNNSNIKRTETMPNGLSWQPKQIKATDKTGTSQMEIRTKNDQRVKCHRQKTAVLKNGIRRNPVNLEKRYCHVFSIDPLHYHY